MKPMPSSLELGEETSQPKPTDSTTLNFPKDHIFVSYQWNDVLDEYIAELIINDYPAHVRNLLTQTVTHEEIRIYSGAKIDTEGTYISESDKNKVQYPSSLSQSPLRLVIKSNKRHNIERAVTWIRRLIDQAMNLPKYKEKVLIGLENAAPGFDVRGKVLGPGGANLQYITNETGAIVTLRGRSSGFIEPTTGLESIEPLHLCVEHNSKYEVLQAGRQLAFNLIETVQQEWFTYQQQMQHLQTQQQSSAQVQPSSHHPPSNGAATQPPNQPPPGQPPQQHHGVVGSSGNSLVSVNTALTTHTGLPPPITTSVPPPLLHQPPPPPLQLPANLNELVQGPPPQIQPGQLNQPPPLAAQLIHPGQPLPTQLVQSSQQQSGQLIQQSHPGQQLVQQTQLIQSGQFVSAASSQQAAQILDQSQAVSNQQLSLIHQGQPPTLVQHQQALGHAMVVPGSGGSVQVLQTPQSGSAGGVQVVQAGHISAALQQHPQHSLQEISHVYTSSSGGANSGTSMLTQQVLAPQTGATGGNATAASVLAQQVLAHQANAASSANNHANILAQQVLAPQASIIAQQPHIISQASYPLQYMQGAGGSGMVQLLYGAGNNTNTGTRDVMLVQYGAGANTQRNRVQPQIVQLVHPATGQVMGTAPLLLQTAGPQQLLLQQTPGAGGQHTSLLLQQASSGLAPGLILPQHQLQFAQPQHTLQILPQHNPQGMMAVSSSGGATVNTSGLMTMSGQCVAVSSPGLTLRPIQAHKRRFEQDPPQQSIQQAVYQSSSSNQTVSQSTNSPQHSKKGIGDEASPSKVAREVQRSSTNSPQQQSNNSKLIIAPSQSDEADNMQHQSRVEIKPDSAKRGRPSHSVEDNDMNKESKQVMSYSYSNGKQVINQVQNQSVQSQSQYQHHPSTLQSPHQAHHPSQLQPSQVVPSTLQMGPTQSIPPPTQQVASLQQVNVSQSMTPSQQVGPSPQFSPAPQVAPNSQFTAPPPPPHYPPHYYQQPPYQHYQTSWNHMHNSNNQ